MKTLIKKQMALFRSFMLLFILTISALPAVAQYDMYDDDGAMWALRIGYNHASLAKDGDYGSPQPAGYIGFNAKFVRDELVDIESGIEYVMGGGRRPDGVDHQLHYLVLPLQGNFNVGPLVINGGANGNFKIIERQEVDNVKVDLSPTNRSNFFDLTLNAGLGVRIRNVVVESRYYWGLFDVNSGWKNRFWESGLKFEF